MGPPAAAEGDTIHEGRDRMGGQYSRRGVSVPAETHMERQPLTRDAVLSIVADQLAEILNIDAEGVRPADRFAEDLRADSLALVELVDMLEEELSERTAGFEFDDEDLADLQTVGDAVDYVMARVGG